MAENYNYTNTWDFSEKHLDPNIGSGDANDFFSAARCILYAKLSADTGSLTQNVNKFKRIGVVQGFGFQESKDIQTIFEIGSDIPYLVPGRVNGQLSVQRVLLSGEDLFNLVYVPQDALAENATTAKGFIASLRDPRMNQYFDLLFAYYGQAQDPNDKFNGKFTANYSRLFTHCLFQGKSESVSSGQIIVAESLGIMYEKISKANFTTSSNPTSFRGTQLVP